jgi:hypothetical protein
MFGKKFGGPAMETTSDISALTTEPIIVKEVCFVYLFSHFHRVKFAPIKRGPTSQTDKIIRLRREERRKAEKGRGIKRQEKRRIKRKGLIR